MKTWLYVLIATIPPVLAAPQESAPADANAPASAAPAETAAANPEKAPGAASTPSPSTSGSYAGGIGEASPSGEFERIRRIMPWFALLDLDRDGKLSRLEMANAPATLRKYDTDGDGHLSGEELQAGPQAPAIKKPTGQPASAVPQRVGKTTPASAPPPPEVQPKVEPLAPAPTGTNP